MTKIALTAVALSLASLSAFAQMSPVGLWKTIDDDTKKEKSLVRITESNGVYSGTIEKLLDPATKQDAVCDKCTDERKDKPILGMNILRNLKQNAEDKGIYDGGDIVDPNNGKVYRTRLKPVEDGKKLEMRGYIGPFYRTQVWHRVE
ncbi:DUF2147 domain-containing protein [Hydrogenophaga sp.]|uniref:DUF2147 domain-containing protein n=1 Tax=Hydrogenophaga sp. TaxID=1904254 RepID=UPI0026394B16|nr:DUF2147 domain-containing protein [Hydrogenophaga sp.]MCW5652908.1 DUF2147 domain-containing protein [Hydrogenophaga sp.]